MGSGLSVAGLRQEVFVAAKTGNLDGLKVFRSRLEQNTWDKLLTCIDSDGRTALMVAAAGNHPDVVELLINLGADVHYVGWKPDGGSALHEAVRNQSSTGLIETLLRRGVSPLVKNASGFTALDYAIQGKDPCLVRKLEDFADFTGYLEVKVRKDQRMRYWQPHWAVIITRLPYPRLAKQKQVKERALMLFEDTDHHEPICVLDLVGSRAKLGRSRVWAQRHETSGIERKCTLALCPKHAKPSGILVEGNPITGYSLKLKCCPRFEGYSAYSSLERFVSVVKGRDSLWPDTRGLELCHQQNETSSGSTKGTRRVTMGDMPIPSTSTWRTEDPSTIFVEPTHWITITSEPSSELPSAPPLPEGFYYFFPDAPVPDGTREDHAATVVAVADSSDEESCVICLDAPKEAGFIHGDSVHRCVCVACAADVMHQKEKECPICRKRIERVINQFY